MIPAELWDDFKPARWSHLDRGEGTAAFMRLPWTGHATHLELVLRCEERLILEGGAYGIEKGELAGFHRWCDAISRVGELGKQGLLFDHFDVLCIGREGEDLERRLARDRFTDPAAQQELRTLRDTSTERMQAILNGPWGRRGR
jgi:hypothetical protein